MRQAAMSRWLCLGLMFAAVAPAWPLGALAREGHYYRSVDGPRFTVPHMAIKITGP